MSKFAHPFKRHRIVSTKTHTYPLFYWMPCYNPRIFHGKRHPKSQIFERLGPGYASRRKGFGNHWRRSGSPWEASLDRYPLVGNLSKSIEICRGLGREMFFWKITGKWSVMVKSHWAIFSCEKHPQLRKTALHD